MKNLVFIFMVFISVSAFAKGNYATVNGMKMYYEVHGKKSGVPLVLIHGGGSTIDSTFSKMIPLLSKNHKIIAVEEQGHGRTEMRKTQESFTQTADDVAELLKQLKVVQADVLGFSNGASSAMQLTIRNPKLVRKLVYISAFTKKSGAAPGFWDQFGNGDKCMMPEELKTAFLKVNPNKEMLMEMCKQDTNRMRNFIETPDEDVKKIQVPVLVMMGDQDVVTVAHGVELTKLIAHSRLAVIPGGHGDFLGDMSMSKTKDVMPEVTVHIIEKFLEQK